MLSHTNSPPKSSPVPEILSILSRSDRSQSDLDFLDGQLSQLRDMQQYTLTCSKTDRIQLYNALRVEVFEDGEEVFRKGDLSEKMYLVLQGGVVMWKIGEEGKVVRLAVLEKGRILGERGLLRASLRMLSATAEGETVLATLDKDSFKVVLAPLVAARTEDKLRYIDTYIPGLRQLVSSTKEQLAFALNLLFFRRGQVLIKEAMNAENLYFVCFGECAVLTDKHVVVKLGEGCWFGGESLFTNSRSEFSVVVASESLSVYQLHRSDSMRLLPPETQSQLIDQYRKRLINWRSVARQFRPASRSTRLHPLPQFPQATTVARRHLIGLSARLESLKIQQKHAQSTAYILLRSNLMWNREVADLPPGVIKLTSRSHNSSPRRGLPSIWDN